MNIVETFKKLSHLTDHFQWRRSYTTRTIITVNPSIRGRGKMQETKNTGCTNIQLNNNSNCKRKVIFKKPTKMKVKKAQAYENMRRKKETRIVAESTFEKKRIMIKKMKQIAETKKAGLYSEYHSGFSLTRAIEYLFVVGWIILQAARTTDVQRTVISRIQDGSDVVLPGFERIHHNQLCTFDFRSTERTSLPFRFLWSDKTN